MEKLKVQQVQDIVYRLGHDQSQRSIARDLGCARETVRRYSRVVDALAPSGPPPSMAELEAASVPLFIPRRSNISSVEPYRAVVAEMLKSEPQTPAPALTRP
jgi:hypothetical protein